MLEPKLPDLARLQTSWYGKEVMLSRAAFIENYRKVMKDIKKLYITRAGSIGDFMQGVRLPAYVANYQTIIARELALEASILNTELNRLMMAGIKNASMTGIAEVVMPFDKAITPFKKVEFLSDYTAAQHIFMINTRAVAAQMARTMNGLQLSERVWNISQNFSKDMASIINSSIMAGLSPKDVAKVIDAYARKNKAYALSATTLKDYPKAVARLGSHFPQSLPWEAFRVARTEMAFAANEGLVQAGRETPFYQGVLWLLSNTHPEYDICDEYAENDRYGLGAGVYPAGAEPVVPHPNCLCCLVPQMVSREEVNGRVSKWIKGGSDAELDKWRKTVYPKFRKA